jgi:hypothetical protein
MAGVIGAIKSAEKRGWISGEFAEARGQQFQNSAAARKRLQSEPLIYADDARGQTQAAQIHEQPFERERADDISFGCFERAALFGFRAGVFEQFGVIHAGGAGGLASEAAEAEIHFLAERPGWFELAISDGAHQRDSAARAVALDFGGVVSGAGGQAKAAVHALLHDGVVEVF